MDMSGLPPKAVVRAVGEHGFGAFAVSRSIQVADDLFLLASARIEDGDLINHSCDPTCGLLGETVVVAKDDLPRGAELTFDYGTCDANASTSSTVRAGLRAAGAGSPAPTGVTGIQMRNNGWFSPYIARRISARHGRSGSAPL